jgi:hypothetical protein
MRFLLLLCVVLLIAAICWPPSFRFGVGTALRVEAWRHHARLSIGKMAGSLWQPLVFSDLKLTHKTEWGTMTELQVATARTSFSWNNLLWKKGAGWWQELALEGVNAVIDLPAGGTPVQTARAAKTPRSATATKPDSVPCPTVLDVHDADIVVRQGNDFLRIDHATFRASELEPNEIQIRAIDVREPWLATRFANVRGTVALQDSRISLADLKLEETVTLQSAKTDFIELLRGQLRMDVALAAFGGTIQGEVKSGSRDEHLNFESTGNFSNISVAQLAAFLGEDADGTIKDGHFTFTGSLRNLPKATLTTRLEATDFRWGSRRWNSLVLGATIVNRRVMIPELQLRQAHNTLSLNGDLNIPDNNWHDWWQGDFTFNIAAKIDNLSELSALFGQGFANISGKLTVDGAVRGQNKSFNGQLIVSGSQLSYRTAPLDELRAAVKLNGNEIQIANAEFTHGQDFLRGQGVVNILGEKRYWGEVKASVANLALYSAFMQPPLAPQAFAGGLMLDWSGDGSANAHSGAFHAQLKKIRPLDDTSWRPLDLDAEGTYSPESIYFSRFVLANADTWLTAKVIADPRSLTLQSLRLEHNKTAWLEGDAQLPLNLWSVWQNPLSAAWWNFESPCKMNLTAQGLSLHEALLLGGRELPVSGEIRGNLTTDGTLADFSLGGQLAVRKAAATTPRGELKTTDADLLFDQNTITIKNARGDFDGMNWSADGNATIKDARDPNLAVALRVPNFPIALSSELQASAALDLRVVGSLSAPHFSGEARLLSMNLERNLSIASLLTNGEIGTGAPLQLVAIAPRPDWLLDLRVIGQAPFKLINAAGTITPDLHLVGTAAAPVFNGKIEVSALTLKGERDKSKSTATVDSGTLFVNRNQPVNLAAHLKGIASVQSNAAMLRVEFEGDVFGAVTDKQFSWESNSDFNDPSVKDLLMQDFTSASQALNAELSSPPIALEFRETDKPEATRPFWHDVTRDFDPAELWHEIYLPPPMIGTAPVAPPEAPSAEASPSPAASPVPQPAP